MVSVVELVDTPDCGSGAAALRVQVPSLTPEIWKSGRVADGTILERWRTERFRGFESHFFLHMRVSPSGRWRESPKLVCVSTTWVRIPTTRANEKCVNLFQGLLVN